MIVVEDILVLQTHRPTVLGLILMVLDQLLVGWNCRIEGRWLANIRRFVCEIVFETPGVASISLSAQRI